MPNKQRYTFRLLCVLALLALLSSTLLRVRTYQVANSNHSQQGAREHLYSVVIS
jgi:hypothetical protein